MRCGFLVGAALGEHPHLAHLLQRRLGHRAGQRRGKVIGDYDLHRRVTGIGLVLAFLVMGFRDRWRTLTEWKDKLSLETYLP